MLMVRFRQTFRERMPEWGMAGWLLFWGIRVWGAPSLFDHPFYHPIAQVLSQSHWALTAILVGAGRLLCLVINGSWRPSAHLRGIGCAVGCMICLELLIGSILVGWQSPATATYALLLFMDGWSLWFAAGDARAADCARRRATTANGTA